jgi:large-conductance mechanosensitive channel
MSVTEKALSLVAVGSAVVNAASFHRLVSGLTHILALTFIGAWMGSVLLIGGFFAIYFGLVHYGLDPYAAAITVALLMFLMMASILLLVVTRIRHLREVSCRSLQNLPGLSQIANIAEAFMEGWLGARGND